MDLSSYFAPLLILLCLIFILWKTKRKVVLGALMYAFIEVWIEPLFPPADPMAKFVFVAAKVLTVFFMVWMLLRGEKGGDG